MNEIYESAVRQYSKVLPEDRVDSRFHVNGVTFHHLKFMTGFPDRHGAATLLGLPVVLDDDVPAGVVTIVTENQITRAARQLAREGRTLNVISPEAFLPKPLPSPIPAPTLRALLRHWWKKVTR